MQDGQPRGAAPGGLRLGSVLGVPVLLSPSWWVGAVVVTVLYVPMVEQLLPSVSTTVAIAAALTLAVLLAASVLAHELGHCVVALRLGLPVRRVRLFLLGGISELVRPPLRPRDEGLIAAAGPAVSVGLAAAAGGLWLLLEPGGVVWLLAVELAIANAAVAVFNLLPGLPLDGGRVLRAAVWSATGRRGTGTKVAAIGGAVVVAALMMWGLYSIATNAPSAWLRFAVIVLMAWFVLGGTGAELSRTQLPTGSMAHQIDLVRLVRPVLQLPAESPIADALAAAAGRGVLLVRADGVAAGLLEDAAAARLADRSPLAPAGRAAVPVTPDAVLLDGELGSDPARVLERVQIGGGSQLLVVDADGRPAGVLRVDDVYAALAGHVPD
jgi:Zn-dependent protease